MHECAAYHTNLSSKKTIYMPAASADTTVRLWRFDGGAAADEGPRYSAEEAHCLQVLRHPLTMQLKPSPASIALLACRPA